MMMRVKDVFVAVSPELTRATVQGTTGEFKVIDWKVQFDLDSKMLAQALKATVKQSGGIIFADAFYETEGCPQKVRKARGRAAAFWSEQRFQRCMAFDERRELLKDALGQDAFSALEAKLPRSRQQCAATSTTRMPG